MRKPQPREHRSCSKRDPQDRLPPALGFATQSRWNGEAPRVPLRIDLIDSLSMLAHILRKTEKPKFFGGLEMSDDMVALCTAMRESIDSITLEWVKRVKDDSYLRSSQSLTLAQIVDHVPQMLEELCDLFTKEAEPDFHDIRASSEHGYIRSVEGYTLTDLLRELELLRNCIFDFVAETEVQQGVNRSQTIRALRRVNKYFGEDVIFVVEYFQRKKT